MSETDSGSGKTFRSPGEPAAGVLIQQEFLIARSGPLPDPATLAQYEKVLPKAAERIFAMAEKEQEFVHRLQTNRELSLQRTRLLGQVFGFLLGTGALLAAVFLLIHDKPLQGLALFLGATATLITAAVWSSSRRGFSGPRSGTPANH